MCFLKFIYYPWIFFRKSRVLSKNGVIIWDYRMFGTILNSVSLHFWFQVFRAMFTYVMVIENNYLQFALKKRSWGCFKDPQTYLSLKSVFCLVPFLPCTGVEGTHGILSANGNGMMAETTEPMNSRYLRI